MAKNVSEQLLDILVSVGVEHVYGVTGDALNFFVKAIEEREDVNWIGMKHEGNASFAAFGQSQTSGKLGVCAGTVGLGALHLINGLYNAKKERTPVIAITGQVAQRQQDTNFFREVDLKKMFDDICDYQAIIKTPEQAPMVIQRAIKIALANNSVCRIELPANVAEMKAQNLGGVFLWLIMELIVLPLLGWGVFRIAITPKIAVDTLVLHLIYGGTLGWGMSRNQKA